MALRHLILLGILGVMLAALRGQPPVPGQPPFFTAEGFAVPQRGRVFEFPRDHGSHPEFKIEWWYVTGHLYAAGGRRFGFQATFFRQAGPRGAADPHPAFGLAHIHLAHMALLDVQTGRFIHQEQLQREGWDASAARETLDLRQGGWSLRLDDPVAPRLKLVGGVKAEAAFSLTLTAAKPLVFFGEEGVSRKGADPTAASHYLTFTRLRVEGELTLGGARLAVTGEAWMDHEISSSQLSAGQVGWDWAAVQFTDGRELMLYRLRLADGTADPASTLRWVDAAGTIRPAPFTWEVLERWKSHATGATYPSRIRLTTTDPATGMVARITLEPLAKDQELRGGVSGINYWEGACRVRDDSGREIGSAFVELTGYAQALKL